MKKRPTWKEYFVEVVNTIAKRGTCNRGQAGAVIVKNNQIISTGYVGSAAGDDHCDEVGHKYEYRLVIPDGEHLHDGTSLNDREITQHCIRTIHAEQNAICQAAKHGHSINGATMYCSMVPCRACAMLIINSGIKEVIALKEYQTSNHTKELFKKCSIRLIILNPILNKY